MWGPDLVSESAALDRDPYEAIVTHQFNQVPVLIGANRDEYRSFAFEDIEPGNQPPAYRGWNEQQYRDQVVADFGEFLDQATVNSILAEYPWPAQADDLTAAYLMSALRTDVGWVVGIGGLPTRLLIRDIATNNAAPTYSYEFNHRNGPGFLPNSTAFEFGAGHNAELAYLFPGHNRGLIAPLFDAHERRLASTMKQWWASFVRDGKPRSFGQVKWPDYQSSEKTMSIRADERSVLIPDAEIVAEHHMSFWDAVFDG